VPKTEMPRAEALPEPLKPLAQRQAVRLTHERLTDDTASSRCSPPRWSKRRRPGTTPPRLTSAQRTRGPDELSCHQQRERFLRAHPRKCGSRL
jgi:hypothetical protein